MAFEELYDPEKRAEWSLPGECDAINRAFVDWSEWLVQNKPQTPGFDVTLTDGSLKITTPAGELISTFLLYSENGHAAGRVTFWKAADPRIGPLATEIFRVRIRHNWDVLSGGVGERVWVTRNQFWVHSEAERFGYELMLQQLNNAR